MYIGIQPYKAITYYSINFYMLQKAHHYFNNILNILI